MAKASGENEWAAYANDSTTTPGTVLSLPSGDACKKCLKVWEFAYRLMYTWIEFCKLLRSDKSFELQVFSARNHLGDLNARCFHLERVFETMVCGRKVAKKEIYASAKELRQLWNLKRLPSMKGIPIVAVPSKNGTEELYVFEDPREPLRTGEHFQMAVASREIIAMGESQHLHSLQGEQLFSKVLNAHPSGKLEHRKTLTVSAAFEKFVKGGQADEAGEDGDEDDQDDQDGLKDDDAADDGAGLGFVPPRRQDGCLYTAMGDAVTFPLDEKAALLLGSLRNRQVLIQGQSTEMGADANSSMQDDMLNLHTTPQKQTTEQPDLSPREGSDAGQSAACSGPFHSAHGMSNDDLGTLDGQGEDSEDDELGGEDVGGIFF